MIEFDLFIVCVIVYENCGLFWNLVLNFGGKDILVCEKKKL